MPWVNGVVRNIGQWATSLVGWVGRGEREREREREREGSAMCLIEQQAIHYVGL